MVYADLQVDDLVRVSRSAMYGGITGKIIRFSGTMFDSKPAAVCNVFVKVDNSKTKWPYTVLPEEIQVLAYQCNLIRRPPKKLTRLELLIL